MITLQDVKTALVAGDTHGSRANVEFAIDQAIEKNCDVVIIVGDFGWWNTAPEMRNAYRFPVFFIEGNHDDLPSLQQYTSVTEVAENLAYIPRNTLITIGAVSCLFVGGAASIDGTSERDGFDYFPTLEVLSESDVERALSFNKVDVVFSHDAPASFDLGLGYNHPKTYVNRENLSAIQLKYRPSHWFFGHYHVSEMKYDYNSGTYFQCLSHETGNSGFSVVFNFVTGANNEF